MLGLVAAVVVDDVVKSADVVVADSPFANEVRG